MKKFGRKGWKLVSFGGGSIGDLSGFVASIYKRGVPLIHIPTTWLSALDSAHGGKNALNFSKVKNLVGTYYFPEQVYIVKEILNQLPEEREREAYGEVLKMAIVGGGRFYASLKDHFLNRQFRMMDFLKTGCGIEKPDCPGGSF